MRNNRREQAGRGSADAQLNGQKKQAALKAASLIRSGMKIGLGTGSTAELFIHALAERAKAEKLDLQCATTSKKSGFLAKKLGLPLFPLSELGRLDVAIDGADQIEAGSLDLIKGHGGALFREKMTALAAAHFIVIADSGKKTERLGKGMTVPVEVVPFGWELTAERLRGLGAGETILRSMGEEIFVTDNGNYVLDCFFGPLKDAPALGHLLKSLIGVVEHGLFCGFAKEVLIGQPDGVEILTTGAGSGKMEFS